jgi:hypothetical protein
VVRAARYAPNRHDTGSTTARSVGEIALIRNIINHYGPVFIASLSIQIRRAGVRKNLAVGLVGASRRLLSRSMPMKAGRETSQRPHRQGQGCCRARRPRADERNARIYRSPHRTHGPTVLAAVVKTPMAVNFSRPPGLIVQPHLAVANTMYHLHPSSGRKDKLMRVTTASQDRFSSCGYTRSKQ